MPRYNPYDTAQAKAIHSNVTKQIAMTERLDEMKFLLEGDGARVGISDVYRQVLLEHIELALEGKGF